MLKFHKGRMYLHSEGEKMFAKSKSEPLQFMEESLSKLDQEHEFFISLLWGDENLGKVIDFSYYPPEIKDKWEVNYVARDWVYNKGVWQVVPDFTCGEGRILFGEEEKLRRRCKGLQEYKKKSLDLDFINSLLDFKK